MNATVSEYPSESFELSKEERCERIAMNITRNLFKEAVSLLMEFIQQTKADDNDDFRETLQLVCGFSALRSGDRDLIRKAKQLFKSAKIHKGMVNLWMAELQILTCQFDEAKRFVRIII